ncbi:MAG: TonB-dependent receptor [Bacteroidales bacterium]|nr:TonB-dependent receptor [Bacteroidales bacterium]
MKRIITIALFTSFFLISRAQYKQTIRGTVVDKFSMQGLLGVNIVLVSSGQQKGTTSDGKGSFRFEEVPAGRHEIQFSYIGYKPVTISNILLSSAHEVVLEVEMEEMVYQGEEVIVKANLRKDQPINQMAQISARSFTVEETERYAGSWGDPARMASNYAGVMAASEARNDIIIRGNSPLGLLWRLEGQNIPNPNHFGAFGTTGGPISMINNNHLRNSDFYTGAFPAEFGNALSGAFDLNMRAGNNQQREYLVQVGLNGFELGAEGPFSITSTSSYLVNYRYSFLGLMSKLGINYGPAGSIPEYQDLSYKLDFAAGKMGKFSLFGLAGLSDIGNYDSKKDNLDDYTYDDFGVDFGFNTGMMIHGINHIYSFSNNTVLVSRVAVAGSFSDYTYDSVSIEDASINLYTRSKLQEWQYSASTELKTRINTRNNINIGFHADVYQPTFNDSTLQNDGTYIVGARAKGTMTLYQSFIEWRHRLNDNVSFYSGVHGQYLDLNSSYLIEPRASIKWRFAKNQSASIGYGLHSQIQPHQLYFTEAYNESTGEYVKTSTQDLDFTKSHHFVLGYDFLAAPNLRFKVETYYQHIYDVPIEQEISHVSLQNYGADFYIPTYDSLVNGGTGRNYGVEFTVEKFFLNNYYFLITTSLFDSKYTASDNIERNSAFNNNYVVNALGGYEFKLSENMALTTSTKFVVAGGNRYIPYTVIQDGFGRYVAHYNYDRAYEKQYPAYMRLDVMLTLRWNHKRMTDEWIIDFENITNRSNLYYETVDRSTGEIVSEYHQKFAWLMMWRLRF